MRIKAEDTRCLVIDYQEKILPAMAEKEQLLKKSVMLFEGLKTLEVPMHMTTQYARGLGMNVPEITAAVGTEKQIDKKTFDALANEEVRAVLDDSRKNVIVAGIEAHICVLQTAIALKEAGFNPIIVEDCVSSRDLHDKEIAMIRAQMEGITITTAESLLFEMTGGAGSPVFKQISALVK